MMGSPLIRGRIRGALLISCRLVGRSLQSVDRAPTNNIGKCILYFPHRVEHWADNPVLRRSALPYQVLGYPELDLWYPRLFKLSELPERRRWT